MLDQDKPSLGALLDEAFNERLFDIHTHLPARIETYDAVKQRCSVQVELRQRKIEPDGSRSATRLPIIQNVPVKFSGGGGFRTTYPLQRGDQVWLEICEGSLALWKPRGGDIDPQDDRRMDLSDAIAVTGLRDFAHPWAKCPTDTMSIGADAGAASIEISSTDIAIGGAGAVPTYKAPDMQSAFTTLLAAIASAIGSSGTPAGAAAAATALTVPVTGPIAAFLIAAGLAQTTIAKVV